MTGMTRSEYERKRNCSLDNEATKTFRKRIWASPNRVVVRRELMESNRKKVGAPFKHPDCIIGWIMRIKAMNKSSYRDVVGDVEDRLVALGLPPLSHSQLYERARILFESLVKTTDVCDGRVLAYGSFPVTTGHDVTAAVDSSGFSLNKYGGWKFHKWNLEPATGWVKFHAMVDVETQEVLSYVITDESCGDKACFERLIESALQAGHRVTRLLADAAYDKREHWKLCKTLGIEFIVNINSPLLRSMVSNRRVISKGVTERAAHIRRIRKIGREAWKKEVGYSVRWRVEGAFSDLKRRFGDIMRARERSNMVADLYWRVVDYNLYKGIRSALA